MKVGRGCPPGLQSSLVLVAKVLTPSDTNGRIILPRVAVETNLPFVKGYRYDLLISSCISGSVGRLIHSLGITCYILSPVHCKLVELRMKLCCPADPGLSWGAMERLLAWLIFELRQNPSTSSARWAVTAPALTPDLPVLGLQMMG